MVDGVFISKIRCDLDVMYLFLKDARSDYDETWRVYTVHPQLWQRHIFNFWFGIQTESRVVFRKPEVENFGTGNRKYDVAKAEGRLYTPSKFHSNRLSHLWEKGATNLKKLDLSSFRFFYDTSSKTKTCKSVLFKATQVTLIYLYQPAKFNRLVFILYLL